MRVYSHYSIDSLANSYVVGPSGPGDAVLIDPAVLDAQMLGLIEGNSYYIRGILVTHCERAHLKALRAILRVYPRAQVFAAVPQVHGTRANRVEHGQRIELCGMQFAAISLPGHSRDSFAYYVPGFVFTGCAVTAGETGVVQNPYAKALLISNVHERILTLPAETVIFPFHGPPSSVMIERSLQPTLDEAELGTLS